MERKREHLAQVDRHIAESKAHIVRQHEIIHYAVEEGQPADLAEGTSAATKGKRCWRRQSRSRRAAGRSNCSHDNGVVGHAYEVAQQSWETLA